MNYEHLSRDKFCEGNIGRIALLKLSEALLIINIVKKIAKIQASIKFKVS
jgi:hypothetical protein